MRLPSGDGAHLYSNHRQHRVIAEDQYISEVDGIHLLHFKNAECPGYKVFNKNWIEFVFTYSSIANCVLIQCRNLFFNCNDDVAFDSFVLYLVFETSLVMQVIVKNCILLYIKYEADVLDVVRLRDFVLNVKKRIELLANEELGREKVKIYAPISLKRIERRLQSGLGSLFLRVGFPAKYVQNMGVRL